MRQGKSLVAQSLFSLFSLSFIFIFLLLLLHEAKALEPLPQPVARVIWIKGSLKALMPNKEERLLKKRSIIYLHDTLVTDANSQAQIGFTDQTMMTFREKTRFYIATYKSTTKSSPGKYVMDLIEGGFRTITGAIAKSNPDSYEVNTPVATIGVRGTDYQIYFNGQQLFVGYYSGSACTTGKKNCKTKHTSSLKGSKTVCLDKQYPYTTVAGPCEEPIPLATKPAVFATELSMTKEFIKPFEVRRGDGTVSSFCIR